MRKVSILTAAAVLALASCTKEATPSVEKTYSMEIVLENSDVKTALNDGTIIWKTGDKIGGRQRYFKDDGSRTTQSKSWTINSDKKSTSLSSSSWNLPKEGTEIQYYFFCPADNFGSTWYTDGDYVKPLVTLPAKQTPVSGSFDPCADIIISKIIVATEPQSKVTPEFVRINSLCNITIKNLPSTANVDSIRFSAVAGGAAVKMAGEFYASAINGIPGSFAKSQTHVTADCSALGAAASSSEGLGIFFSCLPFSLAAGDSFKVEAFAGGVNYVRTVTLTSPMAFSQGRMAKFSVDMSSALPSVDWLKLSQKASSSVSQGNYLAYWTASATSSVDEFLYGVVPAADYLAAVAEGKLDELYGTVATSALAASSLAKLNAGSALNFSVSQGALVPGAEYFILAKVKKTGSDGYLQAAAPLKADCFGFTASGGSSAGNPYHKFYGANLSKITYLCVAKSDLPSPTNSTCQEYFNANTKYSIAAATVTSICNAGAAGYGLLKSSSFNFGSNVAYISMMKATMADGSTKFCWAEGTTK